MIHYFGDGYWIASSCCETWWQQVRFGMRCVYYNAAKNNIYVSSKAIYTSMGNTYSNYCKIKPVVSLKSDIYLRATKDGYNIVN